MEPYKYSALQDTHRNIRLLKLVTTDPDDSLLRANIIEFHHPCHFILSWRNYAGIYMNWKDTRFTEKSGADFGYDALSYAWGTENPETDRSLLLTATDKLYVKGQLSDNGQSNQRGIVNIWENLAALLRQLRRTQYNRFIWIDAICINQQDNEEKNAQLTIMRDIYWEAKNVIIWLGEASSLEEGALDIMPNVTQKLQLVATRRETTETIKPIGPEEFEALGLPASSHLVWPAFGTLMSRSWFRRLWTVQEAVLPESGPIILCGRRKVNWEIFSNFARVFFDAGGLRLINWNLTGNFHKSPSYLHGYEGLYTIEMCREHRASRQWVPFRVLLQASRKREAGHDVDRILGLLGIAAPGLVREINIDVTLPPQAIFTAFAKSYMSHEPFECLLNHVVREEILDGLPSWCPNFAAKEVATCLGSSDLWDGDLGTGEFSPDEIGGFCAGFSRTNEAWAIPMISTGKMVRKLLLPTPNRLLSQKPLGYDFYDVPSQRQIVVSPDCLYMKVSGVIFDTITHVIDVNPGAKNLFMTARDAKRTIEWLGECLHLAKATLGCADSDGAPEVYWRTLIANQTFGSVCGKDLIWDKKDEINRLGDYENTLQWLSDFVTLGERSARFSTLEWDTRFYLTALARITTSRCFFATQGGRIGLGPHCAEVGDEVSIFCYCPTPYLIRVGSKEGLKRFVGEVYVHGMMFGEVLDSIDKGLLEETRLVIE